MKNKKSLILILVSLSFLSISFYFLTIPRKSLQISPMYELLEKKGFVYVESRYHSVRGIDFKNKEAFENEQYLIKKGKYMILLGKKKQKINLISFF